MIPPMEWYLLFLVSIPQVYLSLLLGTTLFNLKIENWRLLVVAFFGGVVAFSIRLIPTLLGVPSLVDVLMIALLLMFVGNIRFSHALCVIMLAMMLSAVLECCILPLCLYIWGINLTDLQHNQILMFLFFIPEALVMLALYFIIHSKRIIMWDLNELEIGR